MTNKPETWEVTVAMIIRGVYLNAKVAPEKDTQVYLEAEREMSELITSEIEKAEKRGYQKALRGDTPKLDWLKDFDFEEGRKAGIRLALETVHESANEIESLAKLHNYLNLYTHRSSNEHGQD